MDSAYYIYQVGLVLGFVGSVLLFYSAKVGVMMSDGRIRFDGLDEMEPTTKNEQKVRSSHWRNKYFTPCGWLCLSGSFILQFIAGLG